jgi:hypothetical protein
MMPTYPPVSRLSAIFLPRALRLRQTTKLHVNAPASDIAAAIQMVHSYALPGWTTILPVPVSFSVDDVVTNLLMKTLEKAAELIAVMAAIQAHNAESRALQ